MTLRTLHRASALLIAIYACIHLSNHLVGLAGVQAHLAFMNVARKVYRQPVVEALLLLCVGFQVVSGLFFVMRGWRDRNGVVPWLQALSGAYLAFFLLVHVSAVLTGRVAWHLDTNFYYAAAGMHVWPYVLFFVPYYFLAVTALFAHLACAAFWQWPDWNGRARALVLVLPCVAGLVAATIITLLLAGRLQPVEIPAQYLATFALASLTGP